MFEAVSRVVLSAPKALQCCPGAATHVLNVDMVGQNLANTTTSLRDKNMVFLFKT
jgi:hypothetical protein